MKAFTTYKTESSNVYNKIRKVLSMQGILIRMENLVMPGLPDCLFLFDGNTIFIELKVQRSGKISMPKFQYSMAMAMLEHVLPHHHWYFIHEDDGLGNEMIGAYQFVNLAHIDPEYVEGQVNKVVRMNIRAATPTLCLTKAEDILKWMALTKEPPYEPS